MAEGRLCYGFWRALCARHPPCINGALFGQYGCGSTDPGIEEGEGDCAYVVQSSPLDVSCSESPLRSLVDGVRCILISGRPRLPVPEPRASTEAVVADAGAVALGLGLG